MIIDLLFLIIGLFGLFITVTMLADLWRMKPDRTIKVTYCKNVPPPTQGE